MNGLLPCNLSKTLFTEISSSDLRPVSKLEDSSDVYRSEKPETNDMQHGASKRAVLPDSVSLTTVAFLSVTDSVSLIWVVLSGKLYD